MNFKSFDCAVLYMTEIATAKFKILDNAFKYTSGERRFLLTATRTFAKPR